MTSILDLSAELLQAIFIEVNPLDIASLAQTCKSFNNFTQHNRLLWKEIYLRHYDNPLENRQPEPEWGEELRRFAKLGQIMKVKGSQNLDNLNSLKDLGDSEDLEGSKKLQSSMDSDRSDWSSPESPAELTSAESLASKHQHMVFASQALANFVKYASKDSSESRNFQYMDDWFESEDNRDVFMCRSRLFTNAGTDTQHAGESEEERQTSARLHVFHGWPLEPRVEGATFIHPYARANVYDLRNYTRNTRWGPFKDQKGPPVVDWEKLESLMIVLAHQLRSTRACSHIDKVVWPRGVAKCAPYSFESQSVCPHEPAEPPHPLAIFLQPNPESTYPLYYEPALDSDTLDPYGITGTWRRVVCFLDYNDLHAFNFEDVPPAPGVPRDPIDTQEATRLITVKLRVTKIEPPGPHDGQDYPVVWFNGSSRSVYTSWDHNASSRIRGTVRQTPEGEIRWTSFSLFHGEERWRSECVQIGGIRSARGVLGTWFDKDYDDVGPAGPTAFWKVSDEVHEPKSREDSPQMSVNAMLSQLQHHVQHAHLPPHVHLDDSDTDTDSTGEDE